MSEYKLTYWNFRAAQGEPIRLIFAYAKVTYEDIRIPSGDSYPLLLREIKDKLPFGHIPVMEYKGTVIAQSTAIGRFLAKKFGLLGADDIEAAKCDEIIDALMDFQKDRCLLHFEADPVKKAEKQKYMVEYTIPKYMGQFNKIASENGGKYLVGKGLTWADLHMAHFINNSETRSPEILMDYPSIHEASRFVFEIPQIKEYLLTRPADQPPSIFTNGNRTVNV